MAITEKMIYNLLLAMKLKNSENSFRRIPLEVESELIQKIQEGNYADIHISPFSKNSEYINILNELPILQYRYLVISAVTLFSRAVIDVGVSPDDSLNLADAFLYSVSYCNSAEDLYKLYQLAAIMYAKQVASTKNNQMSYQVERILCYISGNIFQQISLSDLADYMHLSSNYICNIFSKEMGISIQQYIQREKINIACNLLKFSDRPISTISSYMGYKSQSNFTSIFHKWKNMTPLEYRTKNYKEVF